VVPEAPVVFDEDPVVDPVLVPRMRLPFDPGVAVLCAQGNGSEPGRTHSLPQNRHALDFSNRILPEVMAVAAADGTVVYVVSEVGDEPRAGAGYGNQVRILHEHGLFTLYAHMEQVVVSVGDRVVAGQRLGTLGHTGLAGDRHLHFSLHSGIYSEAGVPSTLEIPKIVTFDSTRSSSEFKCGTRADPWSGEVYAPPVPPEFKEATESAIRELEETVTTRSRLHRYSNATPHVTATASQRFLRPILQQAPTDPVVHYGWAVEVEMPQKHFLAAERHFRIAERAIQNPALNEPWIEAWIENQRGAIAFSESRRAEGEAHFARAESLLHLPAICEFAQRQRQR
jgi:hypothetical protein